eukprot:10929208-Alexandrium_andersonii.AAC.1
MTKQPSKGMTYPESKPRKQGPTRGDFEKCQEENRGYGIPPVTVIWGCNELVNASKSMAGQVRARPMGTFPRGLAAEL